MPDAKLSMIGSRAVLFQPSCPFDLANQQRIWAIADEAATWKGVREAVPGMTNVTLLLDHVPTGLDRIERDLAALWESGIRKQVEGRLLAIDMAYDGPHLAEVAGMTGLPVDQVVRLHAAERMLKPGGHLLMRFPNAQSPFGLVPQHGDPTHRSYLSRSVFEQLIQGSAFEIVRYDHEFRVKGRTPAVFVVRLIRYLMRDLISACFNFIYTTRIPYDAVVVISLRKKAE